MRTFEYLSLFNYAMVRLKHYKNLFAMLLELEANGLKVTQFDPEEINPLIFLPLFIA